MEFKEKVRYEWLLFKRKRLKRLHEKWVRKIRDGSTERKWVAKELERMILKRDLEEDDSRYARIHFR